MWLIACATVRETDSTALVNNEITFDRSAVQWLVNEAFEATLAFFLGRLLRFVSYFSFSHKLNWRRTLYFIHTGGLVFAHFLKFTLKLLLIKLQPFWLNFWGDCWTMFLAIPWTGTFCKGGFNLRIELASILFDLHHHKESSVFEPHKFRF